MDAVHDEDCPHIAVTIQKKHNADDTHKLSCHGKNAKYNDSVDDGYSENDDTENASRDNIRNNT